MVFSFFLFFLGYYSLFTCTNGYSLRKNNQNQSKRKRKTNNNLAVLLVGEMRNKDRRDMYNI
jgi:hypothetical protein